MPVTGDPECCSAVLDDRGMAQGFQEWVDSITDDGDDDTGELATGALEIFREVFDERGPVSEIELSTVWRAREFALAREAVDLVAADIRETKKIDSRVIDVRREDELLIVSFKGNYQTPAMFSLRAPEAICEVAENLRDHVMEEVWTVWPALSRAWSRPLGATRERHRLVAVPDRRPCRGADRQPPSLTRQEQSVGVGDAEQGHSFVSFVRDEPGAVPGDCLEPLRPVAVRPIDSEVFVAVTDQLTADFDAHSLRISLGAVEFSVGPAPDQRARELSVEQRCAGLFELRVHRAVVDGQQVGQPAGECVGCEELFDEPVVAESVPAEEPVGRVVHVIDSERGDVRAAVSENGSEGVDEA
jgi:uncharacterized protein YoaH (UPF0181 family)